MGNICLNYSSIDSPQKKHTCKKCNDTFVLYYCGKSQRNSCRYHNYIAYKNRLYCTICNKFKSDIKSRNCYHSVYKE